MLLELHRPVLDLHGEQLVDGWQPADLPDEIRVRTDFHASIGWPDAFNFHRPSTPMPAMP